MSLPNKISLVTSLGGYVSSESTWAFSFDATILDSDTIFDVEDLGDSKVSLRTQSGRSVYETDDTRALACTNWNAGSPGMSPGIFTIVDLGCGRIALMDSMGLYLSVSWDSLRFSATEIGADQTFGVIDQSEPAPDVPVDPPGTPLIAACTLSGTDQLVQYDPTNGYVYRCPIQPGGLGTPVLLNRSQPCALGCSSIAIASYKDALYLVTYRKEGGETAVFPLTLAGLGKAAIFNLYPTSFAGAARIAGAVVSGVSALLLFYYGNQFGMQCSAFLPGQPNTSYLQLDVGNPQGSGWTWFGPVDNKGRAELVGYCRATGEVSLGPPSNPSLPSDLSRYKLGGIVDRNFSQVASFVAADGAGRVIFLRAGSNELVVYRIGSNGFDRKESLRVPPLRLPTLRLHAVESRQLVSVDSDGSVRLAADSQLDRTSQLELLPDPSGAFRMRSSDNTLLCIDASGTIKICPDSTRDGRSLFRMEPQPGARFRLRTSDGKYAWADPTQGLKTHTDEELQQQELSSQSLFEWNDYGVGGGNAYVDTILGRLSKPDAFPSMLAIRSEYDAQTDRYYFSTRSPYDAIAAGLEPEETLFHAHGSQIGATVPVYLEQKINGQPGYHLAQRDPLTAAQWGYRQLGITCFAGAYQLPGTVPVYREIKIGTSGPSYYFSTRSASEAAARGFQQQDVAFYAQPPLVQVYSSRNTSGSSFYSIPGAPVPAGFQPYDTAFCAYASQVLGTVPVYLEQQIGGQGAYHLAARDAATAAMWGYKQLRVAFYAYLTPQPGTVPIYRERPAGASPSQYSFSMRSAEEARAAGAQQLDIAFYAYLPGAYVLVRSQLIDTALGGAQAKPAYRVVLDCRTLMGQPVQAALTLSATEFVTLQLDDGSTIEVGPTLPLTRSTSADGQLSFTLEPGGRLVVPVIKVKADFMPGTQVLAIAPDQNAHRALANLDSDAMRSMLGSRTELVKKVMGALAGSAPIPVASVAPTSSGGAVAFLSLDDLFKKVGDFFTHTIPSVATDGAKAVSQAVQPVVRAVQQVVPVLESGVNQAVAPGGIVAVALHGASTQVQALIAQGAQAATTIAQQLQAGANVVISFTTAIIHEAGSMGERAFNAFLIDAGAAGKMLIASAHEATQLVLKLVEQAGKALNDLLLLVTSRFSWDNILVTHNGINTLLGRVLRKMEHEVDTALAQSKDSVVGKIRGLGAQFDGAFDAWMNSLPTPLVKGPPRPVDSAIEYFQSLLQKGMGDAGISFTLPPAPTNVGLATGLDALLPGLTPSSSSYLRNLPTDPLVLLDQGPRLFFQAARGLIETSLSGIADLVGSTFDTLRVTLHGAIDSLKQLINAELSIPVLSNLYEQVIMKGNGTKLTLSSLLSLFAAMLMEGSHQVGAGPAQPLLPPALASQFGQTGALAFSDNPALDRLWQVVPVLDSAMRCIVSLVQGRVRAQYAKPREPIKDLKDLGLHFALLLGQGAWVWGQWSLLGPGHPVAEMNVTLWLTGIAFLWIGLRSIELGGYYLTKGLYDIIACCMRMKLWALRDQGAPHERRVSNGLEGAASLLQGLSGGLKLGEVGEPNKVMMCRVAGSLADFTRALLHFGDMLYESVKLPPATA